MASGLGVCEPLAKSSRETITGIGYDNDTPSVFAGYGATVGDNVTLTTGLVIHQKKILDGKFRVGQQLGESLESSTLEETTHAVNVYFGVGIRFGSDPWKQGSGGNDDGDAESDQTN